MKAFTGPAIISKYNFFNFNLFKSSLYLIFLICFFGTFLPSNVEAEFLQGCDVESGLCESVESCVLDGLFGQCSIPEYAGNVIALNEPLSPIEKSVLKVELTRLSMSGLNWPNPLSQCIITYFKFCKIRNLEYDSDFCDVSDPQRIWDLIQSVHNEILEAEETTEIKDLAKYIKAMNESASTEDVVPKDLVMKKDGGSNLPLLVHNTIPEEKGNEGVMSPEEYETLKDVIFNDNANSYNEEAESNQVPILVLSKNSKTNDIEGQIIGGEILPNGDIAPILTEGEEISAVADEVLRLKREEEMAEAVEEALSAYEQQMQQLEEAGREDDSGMVQVVPVLIEESGDEEPIEEDPIEQEQFVVIPVEMDEQQFAEQDEPKIVVLEEVSMPGNVEPQPNNIVIPYEFEQEPSESNLVPDYYVEDVDGTGSDPILSSAILGKLIRKQIDQPVEAEAANFGDPNMEVVETIPLTSEINPRVLLKKDDEKFYTDDMGLQNTEHKIVKGDDKYSLVEGNRVYIKVKRANFTDAQLNNLAGYLRKKVAEPNNLIFDEFDFGDGQLSFRVGEGIVFDGITKKGVDEPKEKRVDSVSGIAQAVYKRRKDILSYSGVDFEETGIGSGKNVVPVVSSNRDNFFQPILIVCMTTVGVLLLIMIVNVYRTKGCSRTKANFYPEVIDHLENLEDGKGGACLAYEELCRQRMSGMSPNTMVTDSFGNGKRTKLAGTSSQNSSVSSWPDESFITSCNLDISTGHIILTFLKGYLENSQKIAEEWESVANYKNSNDQITIATNAENLNKNRSKAILPYDESLVRLGTPETTPTEEGITKYYVNASNVYDINPKHPSYIAAESPVLDTVNNFWHMIWEKGVTLLVNLTTKDDISHNRSYKYWPDDGAKIYGKFEVHLVSEHIWSEDYMVRSFYLKNLATSETRTVTQFHYLAWAENSVAANQKTLLDFRRKVNKSYRGRASPILVHSSEGLGRTGAYLLLDISANRICSGVKELNMAASLEYLRDQRNGAVSTQEQYKMVFSCLAEEVTSLIKSLPN